MRSAVVLPIVGLVGTIASSAIGCAARSVSAPQQPVDPVVSIDAEEPVPDAAVLPIPHAHFLPAGLYFRDGNYVFDRCEGCEHEPGLAIAQGPFSDAVAASAAVESARDLPYRLPPGYPFAVLASDLAIEPHPGEAHPPPDAVFVVFGLFRSGWEGMQSPDTSKLPGDVLVLVSRQAALERLHRRMRDGTEAALPEITQIDDGGRAPAYSAATVERLLNRDEADGRGEMSRLVTRHLPKPDAWPAREEFLAALDRELSNHPPLCEVDENSVHLTKRDDPLTFGLEFAPVDCGEAIGYVRFDRTRTDALIHRPAQGPYRIVQPYLIECDMATYGEWRYDGAGRRELGSGELALVPGPGGC